jgi:hypothetical protein
VQVLSRVRLAVSPWALLLGSSSLGFTGLQASMPGPLALVGVRVPSQDSRFYFLLLWLPLKFGRLPLRGGEVAVRESSQPREFVAVRRVFRFMRL